MPDTATIEPQEAIAAWPAMMTVATLAKYVGLSERQCWKLSASGDLPKPVYPPGCRRALFPKEAVDEHLADWGKE